MVRIKHYANRVNILKYVKTADSWRFAPVVEFKGKVVRDHVSITGRDEHHPEGTYYIEWRDQGKRHRKAVADFASVGDAARLKAIEVEALRTGVMPRPAQPATIHANAIPLAAAVAQYLTMVEAQRSRRTYISYRYTLKKLLVPCYEKNSIDQVTREDILAFMTRCYELGLGHRTVYDKLVVVLQLFKRHGKSGLITSSDWPRFVETIRPIYEPEEIQSMFNHAVGDEAIFLKFMLASGFRDQEGQHVCWRDLDFRHSQVRVTAKALWDFRPKNWEERVVPLPTALIDQLRRLKEARNALPAQLMFPNKRGNPNTNNDEIVKRVAYRAKLNCGQCLTKHGNKCTDGPHCRHFFLHKFRHTFATEHLRHGVDIRTLQTWMGHRDIKSTMVYLKGVQSKDVLEKINAGALAGYMGLSHSGS
jgi:integrase/recombinase XerD